MDHEISSTTECPVDYPVIMAFEDVCSRLVVNMLITLDLVALHGRWDHRYAASSNQEFVSIQIIRRGVEIHIPRHRPQEKPSDEYFAKDELRAGPRLRIGTIRGKNQVRCDIRRDVKVRRLSGPRYPVKLALI